jgi:hypothetical protein
MEKKIALSSSSGCYLDMANGSLRNHALGKKKEQVENEPTTYRSPDKKRSEQTGAITPLTLPGGVHCSLHDSASTVNGHMDIGELKVA